MRLQICDIYSLNLKLLLLLTYKHINISVNKMSLKKLKKQTRVKIYIAKKKEFSIEHFDINFAIKGKLSVISLMIDNLCPLIKTLKQLA